MQVPYAACLNFVVPYSISPLEMHLSLPYIKAGIAAAEEEWDLRTIGSIVDDDDGAAGDSGNADDESSLLLPTIATATRARDRVHCHVGVMLSTPHSCANAAAVAACPGVDFLCFDLDKLTSLALGHALEPSNGAEAYPLRRADLLQSCLHKRIIECDPYVTLEGSTVCPMLLSAITDARRAAAWKDRSLKIVVTGAQCSHPPAVKWLYEVTGVDACMVRPTDLPATLFAAAAVAVEHEAKAGGAVAFRAPLLSSSYVFCSIALRPFLPRSLPLLSIYYCLSAFSGTMWHESNHHLIPPQLTNQQSTQYSHRLIPYRYNSPANPAFLTSTPFTNHSLHQYPQDGGSSSSSYGHEAKDDHDVQQQQRQRQASTKMVGMSPVKEGLGKLWESTKSGARALGHLFEEEDDEPFYHIA